MMSEYNLVEEYFLQVEKMFDSGEYTDGKRLLEEILDMEPGYGRAHNHYGWLFYAKFDNYAKAEYHYRLAVKFAPDYPYGYFNLSCLLIDLKRYEEARTHANEALNVATINRSTMYNELGRIEEMCGNFKAAVANYSEAIRLSMSSNQIEAYKTNMERAKYKLDTFRRRFTLF